MNTSALLFLLFSKQTPGVSLLGGSEERRERKERKQRYKGERKKKKKKEEKRATGGVGVRYTGTERMFHTRNVSTA